MHLSQQNYYYNETNYLSENSFLVCVKTHTNDDEPPAAEHAEANQTYAPRQKNTLP